MEIEHFQEKWAPVFRQEMRQINDLEQIRDSFKPGFALERWEPTVTLVYSSEADTVCIGGTVRLASKSQECRLR